MTTVIFTRRKGLVGPKKLLAITRMMAVLLAASMVVSSTGVGVLADEFTFDDGIVVDEVVVEDPVVEDAGFVVEEPVVEDEIFVEEPVVEEV